MKELGINVYLGEINIEDDEPRCIPGWTKRIRVTNMDKFGIEMLDEAIDRLKELRGAITAGMNDLNNRDK